MGDRTSFMRSRKLWIIALALLGVAIGVVAGTLLPHHPDSGDSGGIGGAIAAIGGAMAAISAAAGHRRRKADEKHDG